MALSLLLIYQQLNAHEQISLIYEFNYNVHFFNKIHLDVLSTACHLLCWQVNVSTIFRVPLVVKGLTMNYLQIQAHQEVVFPSDISI